MNVLDSTIAAELIGLPDRLRLMLLWEQRKKIVDDAHYWQMLAAVWMDTTICTPNLNTWKTLFCAPRRNRHKLMKKADRHAFEALPERLDIYRNGTTDDEAMCFTLDKEVCKIFRQPGAETFHKRVSKDDVICYFNRRREAEVLYIPRAEQVMWKEVW